MHPVPEVSGPDIEETALTVSGTDTKQSEPMPETGFGDAWGRAAGGDRNGSEPLGAPGGVGLFARLAPPVPEDYDW
jgi:hypothetical protein